MTKNYGGSYGLSTPLDSEPADIDAALAAAALEAEQDAHDATVEAESDTHTVLRHSEFYPLDVDTSGWTLEEVEAAFYPLSVTALDEVDAVLGVR